MSYEKMYCVKHNKYLYKLFNNKTSKELYRELRLDFNLLNRLYDDELKCELVKFNSAYKIANYINEDFDDVWEEVNMNSQIIADKPYYAMSHEIIKGLETNIINQLIVNKHKKVFIDNIMSLIDSIVLESVRFGIDVYKKGDEDNIENLIKGIKK